MLVIAASIACATFKLAFLGVVLVVALVALFIQAYGPRYLRGASRPGLIVISLPAHAYAENSAAIADIVEKRLYKGQLESLSSTNGEVVLSYNFNGLPAPALAALGTDLRERFVGSSYNVFFNRPGLL
jgi:hypothetical protein